MEPSPGIHQIEQMTDVLAPVLELDKTNNTAGAETFGFDVSTCHHDSITWEPQELRSPRAHHTFNAKVTNNSSFAISNAFKVDLSAGGVSFRNVKIRTLAAGGPRRLPGAGPYLIL